MCPHGELSQETDQADSPSLPAHPLEKRLFSPGSPRNHASIHTNKLAGTGEGAKPPGSYSQRLGVPISYTLLCPRTQMQTCVSRVHGSPWGQLFLSPVVSSDVRWTAGGCLLLELRQCIPALPVLPAPRWLTSPILHGCFTAPSRWGLAFSRTEDLSYTHILLSLWHYTTVTVYRGHAY